MKEMNAEQIYSEYKEKVTHYISGKVSNSHDMEDLVSKVFEKVLKGLEGFDERKASLSTWIYAITRNTVIDYFRTNKPVCELPEELTVDDTANRLYCREMQMELAASLKQLDQRGRDLIILHYYSGYSLKKVAQMMKISYSNTKNIHRRALCELRNLMDI